ncbi:tripartite tricarboxylate transporter TctB family protein [Massilia sp. R2A-15]|uniref:tripartite tricarboxylate transporter TctB family protein n=1 Tax=Massilia sp. R2A-15 TaxID=3064278 RepID=UPI00273686A8|nr:tripartite tricarboxylate transporter TctB family protein [Massilia sp. R2A-15]WLI91383.1 tripartite tricarboxylate transporter TctB family protein [Massilia sp. R2A-15]
MSAENLEGADIAVTKRTAELTVGAVVAAFGLLAIVSNYKLGAGWAEDGPQAGYFPMRMGIAIFAASLVVIWQALRKNDRSAFVERGQLKLVATVLLPLVVYIAAIKFTGIYVASALFIGIFMALVGKFSWWKSAGIGLAINVVMFWVFEIAFKVPLPKGPLEHLLGF